METYHMPGYINQSIIFFSSLSLSVLLISIYTDSSINQSILKDISPEYSLEGLMLKLKLQNLDHLMRRADSFEKITMLGMIEGRGEGDNRG